MLQRWSCFCSQGELPLTMTWVCKYVYNMCNIYIYTHVCIMIYHYSRWIQCTLAKNLWDFWVPIEEHSGDLWVLLWEIACQIAWIPASLVESQVPTEPSVGLPGKFRYADMPHWPPMMRDMASLLATSHIKPSPLTPLVSLSWPLFKLLHLASDSTTSHPFRGKWQL